MICPPFDRLPASLILAAGLCLGTDALLAEEPGEQGEATPAAKLEFIDLSALAPIMVSVETATAAELESDIVCERRRPTGTRIARETCYARDAGAEPDGPQRRQMLEDLQQMRDTQRLRDMANRNAFQQVFRQRAPATAP